MMIRTSKKGEAEFLGQLWLTTTIASHDFLPKSYWEKKLPAIEKQYLKEGTTFVYEEGGAIQAFVTFLKPGFIGGLFVAAKAQHRGIGQALLNYAKEKFPELELDVYAKNHRAIAFYAKAGFHPAFLRRGEETGEDSMRMRWERVL